MNKYRGNLLYWMQALQSLIRSWRCLPRVALHQIDQSFRSTLP